MASEIMATLPVRNPTASLPATSVEFEHTESAAARFGVLNNPPPVACTFMIFIL